MWSAIVNVMTKMFDALHSLIVSLGVSERRRLVCNEF